MGTTFFPPLQQFLSQTSHRDSHVLTPLSRNRPPTHPTGARGLAQSSGPQAREQAEVQTNAGARAEDQFNNVVYSRQMQRVSLLAELQQARARVVEGAESHSAQTETSQLTFRFFAEVRSEELATFERRIGAVADQLEGAGRESFIAASRALAIRFSVSLEITGAALNGYARAAEKLAKGPGEVFDRFLSVARDVLSKVSEMLNQTLELLGDFFSGDDDVATRFEQFIKTLLDLNFTNTPDLPAASRPGESARGEVQWMRFSFQLEFEFVAEQGKVQESDPITLDLDGDGIELTDYTSGAYFDIQGTGAKVHTAFVTGGDAFLAIDRNGNGAIDSGKELFGDQNGAANGFEELRKLDSNGDGRIDARDADFDKLLLWKDNGNGIVEEGELVSLNQEGIREIRLDYQDVNWGASGGNRITQIASFLREDGTRGDAVDSVLSFLA